MQIPLIQYGGANVQADNAASPNTIGLRDNAGGLTIAQLIASSIALSGSLALGTVPTKTTNFTADANNVAYVCDATGGIFTATLEAASTCAGRIHFFIRSSAANTVTIAGGGTNINGAATYLLNAQYKWIIVVSDGTQWWGFGGQS